MAEQTSERIIIDGIPFKVVDILGSEILIPDPFPRQRSGVIEPLIVLDCLVVHGHCHGGESDEHCFDDEYIVSVIAVDFQSESIAWGAVPIKLELGFDWKTGHNRQGPSSIEEIPRRFIKFHDEESVKRGYHYSSAGVYQFVAEHPSVREMDKRGLLLPQSSRGREDQEHGRKYESKEPHVWYYEKLGPNLFRAMCSRRRRELGLMPPSWRWLGSD